MRDYNINWEEYEYEFFDKSADWFWALGIITLSIAVTAIMLGNLLFAVLILIGSITLSIYAVREPELVKYEVTQRGIIIEDSLYPYGSLDSFWIEHGVRKPKLLVVSKKRLMPHIIIPLNSEVDTDQLRDYLLDHVDEEERRESLSTKIMEYLGY